MFQEDLETRSGFCRNCGARSLRSLHIFCWNGPVRWQLVAAETQLSPPSSRQALLRLRLMSMWTARGAAAAQLVNVAHSVIYPSARLNHRASVWCCVHTHPGTRTCFYLWGSAQNPQSLFPSSWYG